MSDMTSSSPSPFIPHQRSCYRFKEMLTASKSRATGGGREEDGRRTGGGREEDAKRGPSVQNMAIKY